MHIVNSSYNNSKRSTDFAQMLFKLRTAFHIDVRLQAFSPVLLYLWENLIYQNELESWEDVE